MSSFGGSAVCIKQTFHGDIGAFFMLAVDEGGTLYSVDGDVVFSENIAQVGQEVAMNTVHDADAQEYRVYVNGVLSHTDNVAPGGDFFYDKIGAYTTESGTGPIQITWTQMGFWDLE